MNSQGHQNSAPDSWDDTMDAGSGDKDSINDVSKGLSALNVNANPFVPGQNVFAKEFVMPSFGGTQPSETENEKEAAATPEAKEVTEKAQNSVEEMEVEKESPVETPEEEKRDAPDDWEEEGLGSSESTEDDDGGGTNGAVEDGARAVTIKTKKPKPEKISSVKKNHLNIVFIGHVDAGKSTIGGHIMYLTGRVDQRTLEKYEREAKDKNRESWYLSWALDTNQEERDKGKTVEVGRAYFDTENKHFTILDAPGHKSFVPNMIGGASQADVACLVISARKGEFETGFERGGQTREHAMLVKTAGVKRLIVVVNKMDDPTVMWDIERYNEIVEKLTPYLKKCGFNPKTDIVYIPVSGLTGAFLKEAPEGNVCPWYSGPSLIGYLDSLPAVNRMSEGPLRLPIVDRYRDMGTVVLGKLESGSLSKGQVVLLMPNKVPVEVMQLWSDDEFATSATSGENVKIKLKNVEEEDVSPGFVLCPSDNVCHTGKVFDAQIVIIEHKSIICAGYSAVLHIHTSSEEVTIKALICLVDKKTGDKSKTRPRFVKQDQIAIVRLELLHGMVCLETFKDFPQMGRFTLRDEGKTIAMGKVLKIVA